ncbi:MAG: hypothetical protein MHM6MM_001855 [Cercozoa sp. M6MM]
MSDAPIVLDNGSGFIKAGFAGDDAPRAVFQAVVGRPRFETVMVGVQDSDVFVGDDAIARRGLLHLEHATTRGSVNNWEDLERLWHACFFDELQCEPESQPLLLTEAVHVAAREKAHKAEIMFEKFNVPALNISLGSVLSLYASGRTTGLVLDCGDSCTQCIPVFEGFTVRTGIKRLDVGGRDITHALAALIRGSSPTSPLGASTGDMDIVREAKESLCCIASLRQIAGMRHTKRKRASPSVSGGSSPISGHSVPEGVPGAPSSAHSGTASIGKKEFELPDGSRLTLRDERWRACELLFNPTQVGQDAYGVNDLLSSALSVCPLDERRELLQNVILTGGTTLLDGFAERLHSELHTGLGVSPDAIKVVAPPERKYSVWIGGSILASLSSFAEQWCSREDWQEQGDSALARSSFV